MLLIISAAAWNHLKTALFRRSESRIFWFDRVNVNSFSSFGSSGVTVNMVKMRKAVLLANMLDSSVVLVS